MWIAGRVAADNWRLVKQNRELMEHVRQLQEQTIRLTDAEFVLRTIQKTGIGPYLPLASERMARDIESLCQQFGMTEKQAIQWLTNQVVEASDGQ